MNTTVLSKEALLMIKKNINDILDEYPQTLESLKDPTKNLIIGRGLQSYLEANICYVRLGLHEICKYLLDKNGMVVYDVNDSIFRCKELGYLPEFRLEFIPELFGLTDVTNSILKQDKEDVIKFFYNFESDMRLIAKMNI